MPKTTPFEPLEQEACIIHLFVHLSYSHIQEAYNEPRCRRSKVRGMKSRRVEQWTDGILTHGVQRMAGVIL